MWASQALAVNTIITRQIANAPGWQQNHAYGTYQAVQSVAITGGSGCAQNDIVTVQGGTSLFPAKLYIAVNGGSMGVYAIGPAGAYSVTPGATGVSATGGSCSGLTLSLTYVSKPTRVVAGPGWTAGSPGSFTSGSALYLWEATQGTIGNSSASGNGPAISGSCAASAAVSDGAVTWKCLTQVDYTTITGFYYDNQAWAQNGTYYAFDTVVNGGRIYRLTQTVSQSFVLPNVTCTSAGSGGGPSGTGTNITDNTCAWVYIADLPYTSQAGYIPTQNWFQGAKNGSGGSIAPQVMMQDYYVGNVWYGGVARQEYIPGQNSEMDPIFLTSHWSKTWADVFVEVSPLCKDDHTKIFPDATVPGHTCAGTLIQFPEAHNSAYTVTLKATTDSFQANPSIRSIPLTYNSANGSAIHALSAAARGGPSNTYAVGDAIHGGFENGVTVASLQIIADHGVSVDGLINGNQHMYANNILIGNGWCPALPCYVTNNGSPVAAVGDGTGTFIQNLIIYTGSDTGATGVLAKFAERLYQDTIVNLGSASPSSCFRTASSAIDTPWTQNTYCAGFTYSASVEVYETALTADVDASTLSFPVTSAGQTCCSSYRQVDQETVGIQQIVNPLVLFTRGAGGTVAVSHLSGATMADAYTSDPTSAARWFGNAVSNARVTSVVPFTVCCYYGVTVGGTINMPKPDTVLYDLAPASQFVDPLGDFRLLSSSALRGHAQASSATIGTMGWDNSVDITGFPRPQSGVYDTGVFQTSSGPPPQQPGGRMILR